MKEITVKIADIILGEQWRALDDNKVDEYAESMKAIGQTDRVGVVRDGDKWRLEIGFHRYKAAQRAGLTELPAKDLSDKSELELWLLKVSENIHHKGLSLREEVAGIMRAVKAVHRRRAVPYARDCRRHWLAR